MSRIPLIPRRMFLQGAGASIALPWLEAMFKNVAHAQSQSAQRVLTCYFPYGVYNQGFAPTDFTANFQVPAMLKSIAPYRNRVVLTKGLGLYQVPAQFAHYNALTTFMTGLKVPGACNGGQLRVGTPSAGYKIQQFMRTKNPGLKHLYMANLQCQPGGGDYCDGAATPHGISVRYQDKMEWSNTTTPMSATFGPQAVFDALFAGFQAPAPGGGVDPLLAFRRARGLSVLDSTLDQQASLVAKLGASDQQKLDQYFTAIREVEKTLKAGSVDTPPPVMACTPGSRPNNGLRHDIEIKLFMDLIALAFACDRSRVLSYTLDNEGSGYRTFDFLGQSELYHDISHWNISADRPAKFMKGNQFYADQLGYLLGKLASFKEGDKDLLYNSVVVFGSGHGNGADHSTFDLPIVLAGELGGSIATGKALNLPKTPLQNVYLTIMKKLGMPDTSHGDSTGVLPI